MAKTLINQLSGQWTPEQYHDEYAAAVMKPADEKVKAGGRELPGGRKSQAQPATNVVDLVKVLQESLAATGKAAPAKARLSTKSPSRKRTAHKHAA